MAFAYPLRSEDDIKSMLDELRKKYHDARHHCYAWRLGEDRLRYRANDDGEPSSTAGKPILGRIDAHDLTNVLIVVVRYFGGTKLGVGGLIHAYREAAADAIKNSRIIEKKVYDRYVIACDYPLLNSVMKIIKDHRINYFDADFSASCSLTIELWRQEKNLIIDKFQALQGIKIKQL